METTRSTLRGRVFARQRAFLALPVDEQQQVLALQTFLDQSHVLRQRRVGFRHLVEGISCDQLADAVLGYLEKKPQLLEEHLQRQQMATASAAADENAASLSVVATRRRRHVAWQFVDRMVLSGFLALHNEENDPVLAAKLDDFARPDVLFVTTTNHGEDELSVWDLREDASMAGPLRRAGKVSKTIGGHDAYFVLDGKRKVLFWFDSDAATEVKGHVALEGAALQSSGPLMACTPGFTVRVAKNLYLIGPDAADWINPMISCGAEYDSTLLVTSSRLNVIAAAGGKKGSKWGLPIVWAA
ncbi:hypothetical protein Gpo141_00007786 [Globisporangium polare]